MKRTARSSPTSLLRCAREKRVYVHPPSLDSRATVKCCGRRTPLAVDRRPNIKLRRVVDTRPQRITSGRSEAYLYSRSHYCQAVGRAGAVDGNAIATPERRRLAFHWVVGGPSDRQPRGSA